MDFEYRRGKMIEHGNIMEGKRGRSSFVFSPCQTQRLKDTLYRVNGASALGYTSPNGPRLIDHHRLDATPRSVVRNFLHPLHLESNRAWVEVVKWTERLMSCHIKMSKGLLRIEKDGGFFTELHILSTKIHRIQNAERKHWFTNIPYIRILWSAWISLQINIGMSCR